MRSGEQEHEEERANDKMGERMARLPYALILHNFLSSCTATGVRMAMIKGDVRFEQAGNSRT